MKNKIQILVIALLSAAVIYLGVLTCQMKREIEITQAMWTVQLELNDVQSGINSSLIDLYGDLREKVY